MAWSAWPGGSGASLNERNVIGSGADEYGSQKYVGCVAVAARYDVPSRPTAAGCLVTGIVTSTPAG
jgi:hypothetical protein